jgi:hypothetical protein
MNENGQSFSRSSIGEQRPHERPLVAHDALALVPDAVGCEQLAILLVPREAGKAEQRERLVTGPFGRQEVAVVSAAVPIDQLDPAAGKAFEGIDPRPLRDCDA